LPTLFLGCLLAAYALFLAISKEPYGAPLFGAAAVIILAGLAGLLVLHAREKQRPPEEDGPQEEPRVYRTTPCKVDAPMVEKLAKATATLKQRAADRAWEPDWTAYQRHADAGDGYRQGGNLPLAFREYCRAMRTLTEALSRQRHKEELFQPVWDKHA
jgi:hypothetical protein